MHVIVDADELELLDWLMRAGLRFDYYIFAVDMNRVVIYLTIGSLLGIIIDYLPFV
jgi:hypothetical protein